MAFAERLFRKRNPLEQIIGFAGGNLGEQLNREGAIPREALDAQQPQTAPTMADRYMAQAVPEQQQSNPFQDRLMSRSRRTQPRDIVADDSQYLRELEGKPLSWRDKAGLVAQNIARNLGGEPLPTRRQRELADVQGSIGREMAIQKQRTMNEQGQLIPVTLADGSTVMAPARIAGGLQSQQQGFSARRQQIEDHRKRWEQMGSHEAAQDAQKLFNSGAADDNDDLKDEIVRRMGLPAGTRLPNHDKGQVQVDGAGNFILVNPKSGTVTDTARPESSSPVSSMQGTVEKGRQRRFEQGEIGKDRRVGMQQAGADRRTGSRQGSNGRKLSGAERRDIAEEAATINSIHRRLTAIDDNIKRETDPDKLAGLRAQREKAVEDGALHTDKLNRLDPDNEWGSGTGGYPYTKPRTQSAAPQSIAPARTGRTIEGAIEAFRKKTNRDPTPEEVNKMKAALGQ